MPNPLNKIKYWISYIYRNILSPRILTRKYKNILDKNLEIKNLYPGKRCFVFGSGPSIKDLDLDKFKDEYVFVVNEFDRHPQFKNLQHAHHVIPDMLYFTDDKSNYFWERIKNKSDTAGQNTVFFFNIKGGATIEKEGLFPKNKIYYLSTQGIISGRFGFNIELNKTLPWPKNSILSCLMIAVYMGFKEIYLLGCEHNFLSHNIGLGAGRPKTYEKFFTNNELEELTKTNSKEAEQKLKEKYSWGRELEFTYEQNIAHILQLFKNYRLFYKKVGKQFPDIKIFNATPNSFLDVFPAINLEEIKGL
ncbi:MAG: hypothetical protein Q8R34_01530 [bacterium]|nr:hypothetical protein [bacterium]